MMTSRLAFGLKRFLLSYNQPCSYIRLLSRNTHALIFRGARHKFSRYGAVGLSDVNVCKGRCFSNEITATSAKQDKDILLENLVAAGSALDVLNIVGAHHTIMNTRHLIQALQSLFKLRKLDGLSGDVISTSPEFLALCKRLKSQARGIELNDTVDALKILTRFGLQTSNVLVQALLEIIRHKVNDLSLQQIVYVEFLMTRMNSYRMVDALKIALPLVFEVQLSTKLDRTNMPHLAAMLQYASKRKVSMKSLETIVESLTTLTERGAQMDTKTAKVIVLALTNNRKRIPVGVLLQRCLTTLADKIEECQFDEIDLISSKLVGRIVENHTEFYHEDFMDRCANYVIKNDCGIREGSWILKKLTRIGHTNFDLLDYMAKKIVAEPSKVTNCQPFTLLTIVTGFSNADYKPADWEIIRDIIINHRLLEEGQMELPWMKFAIELASLGCFSSSLLERIFQESFLKKFLERKNNRVDHLQLLLLNQAVATLYPSYGGPLPPPDILRQAVACNDQQHHDDFPLEAALARGLGGPTYLQTSMFTRFGIYVDHVIVMRKGGFPIALNPPVQSDGSKPVIEDLEVPANSQIVAVLALQSRCYSRNSDRLRGNVSLQIRSLEALNLSVVPVSLKLWSQMPENERIPYLMQSIKLKCQENEDVSILQ